MTLPGEWVDPNPPATLAIALSRSVVSPRFCLEVTCGIRALRWKPASGGGLPANVFSYALGDGSGAFNDSVDEIVGMSFEGVALAAVTTYAALLANTFMWDWQNQRLLACLGGPSPMQRDKTALLMATYRFSDGPTDAGGYRWRPWLTSLPSLTSRVATDFNGIPQIGGGTLVLQNENHFFDSRKGQNWDAGRCVLKMGASGLPWAQFVTLATFVPSSIGMTDKNFSINVQDPKVLLDALFPSVLYDSITHPNIDPSSVGQPVQLVYGVNKGIVPVCIDTVALVFKVAGHAILSFDGVRVQDQTTNSWEVKNFLSTNAATGEFTLSPVDWQVGQGVVVDVSGKKRTNGTLMDNPAEILKDMLLALGQPVDAAGFETARLWYDAGFRGSDIKDRVSVRAPSVYLDTQAKAISTIEEIMVNVRAYLVTLPNGNFSMVPFRNYQGSTLPLVTDNNSLEAGLQLTTSGSSSSRVQAGSKTTQANVNFAIQSAEGFQQVYTYTSPSNRLTRGLALEVPVTVDSLFTKPDDAAYLAQSLVNDFRVDPKVYTLEMKWLPFTWGAATHIHYVSARHGIDVVLEILQLSLNLTARKVTMMLGNLRGFEQSSGFWVLSTDLTPTGASLAWPPNGQDSDPTETEYRRHQAGHWHGTTDFALDPALATQAIDKDSSVSRWQ